jgi:hypothetical protein
MLGTIDRYRLVRLCRRALAVALLALGAAGVLATSGGVAWAQTDQSAALEALRTRVEERYTLLPIQEGLALAPRAPGSIRSVEIRRGIIAVDGVEVTGAELRERLGADADLVLELSYLDATSRSALLGGAQATPAPAVAPPAPEAPRPGTSRRRGALVRFGGNVSVPADEIVTEDVVVIGGSADIDGQVEGDVVVVGGSARLGPQAEVRRDVTVVGGTLDRDPGARVGGEVTEVAVGGFDAWRQGRFPRARRGGFVGNGWPFGDGEMSPWIRFGGTLARLVLLALIASVVVLVARTPVERVAARAAAEPFKSWLVGFVAELALVPVLVITVVGLVVSIIGIPLLLLVPVALMALVVVLLVGYAGVAQWLGRRIQAGLGWSRGQPIAATVLGIGLLVVPILLGRLAGLAGGLGALATILVVAGVLVEYAAWTVGLGAAALVRFGAQLPASPAGTPDAAAPVQTSGGEGSSQVQ